MLLAGSIACYLTDHSGQLLPVRLSARDQHYSGTVRSSARANEKPSGPFCARPAFSGWSRWSRPR